MIWRHLSRGKGGDGATWQRACLKASWRLLWEFEHGSGFYPYLL